MRAVELEMLWRIRICHPKICFFGIKMIFLSLVFILFIYLFIYLFLINKTRELNDLLLHQSSVEDKTHFIVYSGVRGPLMLKCLWLLRWSHLSPNPSHPLPSLQAKPMTAGNKDLRFFFLISRMRVCYFTHCLFKCIPSYSWLHWMIGWGGRVPVCPQSIWKLKSGQNIHFPPSGRQPGIILDGGAVRPTVLGGGSRAVGSSR